MKAPEHHNLNNQQLKLLTTSNLLSSAYNYTRILDNKKPTPKDWLPRPRHITTITTNGIGTKVTVSLGTSNYIQ